MHADLGLGKLIPDSKVVARDAIHVAVAPVVATVPLAPGDRIDFATKDNRVNVTKVLSGGFGIVDPFLDTYVMPGQGCWAFLFPNTVTGLRHDWEHPSFKGTTTATAQDVASARITDMAKLIGHPFETFDALMEHVESCIAGGDHYVEHGHEHMRIVWYEIEDEFWKHYESLTGKKKPVEHTWFFCCSC